MGTRCEKKGQILFFQPPRHKVCYEQVQMKKYDMNWNGSIGKRFVKLWNGGYIRDWDISIRKGRGICNWKRIYWWGCLNTAVHGERTHICIPTVCSPISQPAGGDWWSITDIHWRQDMFTGVVYVKGCNKWDMMPARIWCAGFGSMDSRSSRRLQRSCIPFPQGS